MVYGICIKREWKGIKVGGIMTFYKLFYLIYRRTDYYKLDRIRRKLMYSNAEQEKSMELFVIKNVFVNVLNRQYEGW